MGDTMPDNTCETSEWLQSTQIPGLDVPNTAPEAICKAPAKIPRMAVFDIRSAYAFTADEFDMVIEPVYIQADNFAVSSDVGDTEECVENSDTSTNSFTWVDWLTPISELAGDRLWVLDGEELECTETGDLSDDPDFKRPALPMASFNVVLPVPLTPPVTYDPDNGGIAGGGGGGGGGGGSGGGVDGDEQPEDPDDPDGGTTTNPDPGDCDTITINGDKDYISTVANGCTVTVKFDKDKMSCTIQDLITGVIRNTQSIVTEAENAGGCNQFLHIAVADTLLESPYESITITPVESSISGAANRFQLDVDWTKIVIGDTLAGVVKTDTTTTPGSVIVNLAPDIPNCMFYVMDGKLMYLPLVPKSVLTTLEDGSPQFLEAQPSSVLGVDENGNFTWMPYSDCEAACQTDEGSGAGDGGGGASGAA